VKRRVLLVGWDAADWKVIQPLMEAGKMPHVRRLVENGVSGQITTLYPPLSPMLWTSIATGKRPFSHGIHGFSEPTPDGSGVQPVSNLSRTAKALWNILNQNGLRSVVIGWWPSHPAEPVNGVMVSDHFNRVRRPLADGWPLPPNAVHPPELAQTLAARRVHPDQLTPEMVLPFIPLARDVDQDADKRLALCMRTLAECMSIQSAAEWLLDHEPWEFFAVYYDSIDHFSHGFMKYNPPRQEWIGEREFDLYSNVVSMAYQLHDRMLGSLLRKAGDDTTVILMSDHGFHPDHLRPASIPKIPAGPAIEHRDLGIIAMGGPAIQKHEVLYGASVLDVAPTILTLYGLPLGQDMEGKVLTRAFDEAPDVKFIPSWEDVPGPDGRHPAHTRLDPVAAHAALEQMIALGYIEPLDASRELAVVKTIRDLRYNLGEAYQDAARHREAYEIFSELAAADREEERFAVRLFVSCQALGMQEEMRRIADEMDRRNPPVARFLKAQVLTAEKGSRRCGEAQQVYEKALEINPDDTEAYLGLCRVALRRGNFSVAADAALQALQRVHQSPMGHFLLGRALTGMKEYERAADAFRAAISFNPNFPEAHVRLARLLKEHLGEEASAQEHRALARRMRVRESLVVVTGLPRSGTSLLMQMLQAGGMSVLSDGLREADEDNPRGYLEFEPVKNLRNDSKWLFEARGKAVKIVAPLLGYLPAGLPCRVILSERDLDEVLDSQERMLRRGNQTPGPREVLKQEYARMLGRVKRTDMLVIDHGDALSDPLGTADKLDRFLGGGLDVAKMAAVVVIRDR
jgi:predicted AlkP superfamily phosphohydrolase/phosphomutase/tetratricopeptide (TPR) repeat protein